jgi:hypothetical protein
MRADKVGGEGCDGSAAYDEVGGGGASEKQISPPVTQITQATLFSNTHVLQPLTSPTLPPTEAEQNIVRLTMLLLGSPRSNFDVPRMLQKVFVRAWNAKYAAAGFSWDDSQKTIRQFASYDAITACRMVCTTEYRTSGLVFCEGTTKQLQCKATYRRDEVSGMHSITLDDPMLEVDVVFCPPLAPGSAPPPLRPSGTRINVRGMAVWKLDASHKAHGMPIRLVSVAPDGTETIELEGKVNLRGKLFTTRGTAFRPNATLTSFHPSTMGVRELHAKEPGFYWSPRCPHEPVCDGPSCTFDGVPTELTNLQVSHKFHRTLGFFVLFLKYDSGIIINFPSDFFFPRRRLTFPAENAFPSFGVLPKPQAHSDTRWGSA